MHGTGSWNPILISDSIKGFVKALALVSELGKGRENPVELERNPLPSGEREEAIEAIRKNNQRADMSFWQDWLALE